MKSEWRVVLVGIWENVSKTLMHAEDEGWNVYSISPCLLKDGSSMVLIVLRKPRIEETTGL